MASEMLQVDDSRRVTQRGVEVSLVVLDVSFRQIYRQGSFLLKQHEFVFYGINNQVCSCEMYLLHPALVKALFIFSFIGPW